MVDATVVEKDISSRNGNHHHEDHVPIERSEGQSAARKALIGIFNFTLGKLQEFTQNDIIQDRDGFRAVFKIMNTIGTMVVGDEQVETLDEIEQPLAAVLATENMNGNGTGHMRPKTKAKRSSQVAKPEKPIQLIKFVEPTTPLSPQEAKLNDFLRESYKPGRYISEKSICKVLGINHAASVVARLRDKGVPVSAAYADRKAGKKIPDNVSGFILAPN